MTLNKKLRKLKKKMTSYGMNLIKINKPIGNKKTILIGSNGK